MQQIMQNPRQFESIVNTPYMQSMMNMLANNPAMSRLVVESNPQLAANPEMREQVVRSLPAMMQQVHKFTYELYKKKFNIKNMFIF